MSIKTSLLSQATTERARAVALEMKARADSQAAQMFHNISVTVLAEMFAAGYAQALADARVGSTDIVTDNGKEA